MNKIHQHLKLQPQTHTGKFLHHHHTSYRGLAVIFTLAGLFIAGLNVADHAVVGALMSVSATVRAPLPSQPPIITFPASGQTVHASRIVVGGTCPFVTPQVIVQIVVDKAPIGTGVCNESNLFSVAVDIAPGTRQVSAQSFTIDGSAGPASAPQQFIYTPRAAPSTQPTANLTSEFPLDYLGADHIAHWSGTLSGTAGGSLNIAWGDGERSVYDVQPGKLAMEHRYARLASHNVLITKYREVTKLKNTYVDTLPNQVDGHSRLHTTFALTVAQTGRLSSNDPNLQNIPVRTELGKRIRTAFVAGKDKKLISADYSQFELRLAAAMSGDDDMVAQFNRGADIHVTTAAQIYGRELEDVTKQMRSAAKTVNFGVLYGMSPHGLSIATGMSFEQAKKFIDAYFDLRKPLLGYLNGLKDQARKDGYVETLFGRRRPMPDIHSSNFMVRQGAERAAMNMPIQGTEADLMKLAMVAVDKKLEKIPSARQLLQIHDSILIECDEADAQAVADVLKRTMEAIDPDLPVNLLVDTSVGQNWGEL